MNIHNFERTIRKKLFSHTVIGSKPAMFLTCILCVITLSGCSAIGDFLLQQSGAMSEEEYEKYIELRNAGQLDEDGRYMPTELNEETVFSPPADSVHVTFSENAYIAVQYYLDAEHKTLVDQQQCYLKAGQCIYASEPECHHPVTSGYSFDRFSICSYDAEGNKGEELFWQEGTDPLMVLRVPENNSIEEISIIPMGKYEKRQLELADYYTDSVGSTQELDDGTWIINDEEATSHRIKVSPVEPLAVDYKYDPQKYAYVSSNPSSFYHEDGLVRFELVDASTNIDCFSVELRPILDKTFLFDPSEYTVTHGTVKFEHLGETISEPKYIPDGDTIQYTATPDSGYRHPKRTGQILVNVSNPDKTIGQIKEAIKFYADENVKVNLPRPDGGTIEYTANGKVLTGNSYTLSSGTTITMKFKNWNGWINNIMDGAEYVVTGDKLQTVALKGVDIKNAFTEADSHKPTLNIILNDSVKDVKFDISASGTKSQINLNYENGKRTSSIPLISDLLGQNDRIIFSDLVGTYPAITLTAKNDTILAGYALKLDIRMKDTRGNESNEIRYIEKLPVEEEIKLYNQADLTKATTVYETVTIMISKVEVVSYQPKSVDHAKITATLADMTVPYTLKNGDVLEASRNVMITIAPENGYYVNGAKDIGGKYSETMTFSKWEKEYQRILNKHPIKKIWYVTLNTADSYGNCVYKLDGTVVSGRVGIREGQKLTLDYTLIDSNYQIVRSGVDGFVGGLVHSKTENRTISVSAALDGRTIQRSDYIEVKRKG